MSRVPVAIHIRELDSDPSLTITRRTSKPSRNESVHVATSHTRERQRSRHDKHAFRLRSIPLCSMIVSSAGVRCSSTDCQPSVFNASHRCRVTPQEERADPVETVPWMDDQNIKANASYISLTNLSTRIAREPNVSRQDLYARSNSSVLLHKPSLFLTNLFRECCLALRALAVEG